jgi:hypothetical protein
LGAAIVSVSVSSTATGAFLSSAAPSLTKNKRKIKINKYENETKLGYFNLFTISDSVAVNNQSS